MAKEFVYATREQWLYAHELGIELPVGAGMSKATSLITRRLRQLGLQVLASGDYRINQCMSYPNHGVCRIVTIHPKTLKVTMEPVEGGDQFIIDVANLRRGTLCRRAA